jgi:N utilization substance protein B
MKRRHAREIAIQSLYHMEMNELAPELAIQTALEDVEETFGENEEMIPNIQLRQYIEAVVVGTWSKKEPIDQLLADFLQSWKIDRLSRVDRQILRLAVFEMIYSEDVPPKAVVNEAIELSKHYGTEESGKFVNGVLGKLIKQIDEIKQKLLV